MSLDSTLATLAQYLPAALSFFSGGLSKDKLTAMASEFIGGRGMETLLNHIADSADPKVTEFRAEWKAAAAKQGIVISDMSALLKIGADVAKQITP